MSENATPDTSATTQGKAVTIGLWVATVLTLGALLPWAIWRTMGKPFTGKATIGCVAATLAIMMWYSTWDTSEPDTKATSAPQREPAATSTTETTSSVVEIDQEAIPEPSPQPKAKAKAVPPMIALQRDVKKNTQDALDKGSVKSVLCDNSDGDRFCLVEARVDFLYGGEEGFVREAGEVFHQVFRDTNSNYITLKALGDTTDELGNETKDDAVGTIAMRRAGWQKVNWQNLKYDDPRKIELVAEIYAMHVNFG